MPKKPTETGWYWRCGDHQDGWLPAYVGRRARRLCFCVWGANEFQDISWFAVDDDDGMWGGPITKPPPLRPEEADMPVPVALPTAVAKLSDRFCGCGDSEAAWRTVYAHLKGESNPPKDGANMVVAYLLDHLHLTEHGISVRWASASKQGERVVAFLDQYGFGWDDDPAYDFIDTSGCHHSNAQPPKSEEDE